MARQRSLFVVMTDVSPKIETGWNNWYNTRHIPDRLGVPGFLAARRFVAVRGSPKYLTLYELTGIEVLSSHAYLALRQREASLPASSFEVIMPKAEPSPLFPNHSRSLYEQIYSGANEYRVPETGTVLIEGYQVLPDDEAEFNTWYNTKRLPALKRIPGVVAARRFMAPDSLPPMFRHTASGPKHIAVYDVADGGIANDNEFLRVWDSPAGASKDFMRYVEFIGRRIWPAS